MRDVLVVAKEFFELPAEDKASFCTDTASLQGVRLTTSFNYVGEKFNYWRDSLRHPCHPLQDHIKQWPNKPPRYKDVVGRYAVEVRKLSMWLLELICEGYGLESGYFDGGLSQGQSMALNYYPVCPDPSLVLGLPKHGDSNLFSLLNQGEIPGLQVLKDERWTTVQPIPNAFVVNINYMLQVISNGKLKSAEHRVVTNSDVNRATVVSFIVPSFDCRIEPAKALVNERNPPLYKPFAFMDFLQTYATLTQEGKNPLQHFMI